MDILKDDLLKNKYFRIFLGLIAFAILIFYVINYFSVESRCERYVNRLSTMLNVGNNRITQVGLESVTRSEIEDCIKKGGPN